MGATHHATEGDSIASLAEASGHFPGTVWHHPRNQKLRMQRKNMNTLAVGDAVFIPELRPKAETVAVDKVHRFRRRGVPAVFRLQLRRNGKPRANLAYRMEFAGLVDEGTTDDNGVIEAFVPPSIREIRLFLGGSKKPRILKIGQLEPVGELRGMQQRLRNLGYACAVSGTLDDATRAAVQTFQRAEGLPISDEPDEDTLEALRRKHDRMGVRRG